jgi:hypothetical protein
MRATPVEIVVPLVRRNAVARYGLRLLAVLDTVSARLTTGSLRVRYYAFPGGCVTCRFVLAPGASPVLATAVGSAVAFMPRSGLVDYVRRTEGLALCGRGAACPG